MISRLREAAQKALKAQRFQPLIKLMPAEDRNNPEALLEALAVAANADAKGAGSGDFRRAHAALTELVRAQGLADKIAAAYHDPELRSQYGAEAIERAWHDPATARSLLVKESAAGRLSPAADAALRTIYEAQEFASQQGASLPQPASVPVPAGAALASAYDRLIRESAGRRLTPDEHARLQQLGEAKAAQAYAAQERAERTPAKPAAPDEYDQLIQKSAVGKLSPEDNLRLLGLAGDRAVAAGAISADDLEAEMQQEDDE